MRFEPSTELGERTTGALVLSEAAPLGVYGIPHVCDWLCLLIPGGHKEERWEWEPMKEPV